MACHTPPHRILVNPGIGETAIMLKGLALIRTLGVITANDNGHVLIRKNSHPLVGDQCGAICGILQVGEELGLVHHRPVVVGVHKCVADQAVESLRVMVQLRLVPGILQSQQLAFVDRGI